MEKITNWLIPNWKSAWKFFSIQAITAALVWEMLPLETRALLPDSIEPYASAFFLVIAALGRVVDQPAQHVDTK